MTDIFEYNEDMLASHCKSISHCPEGWTTLVLFLIEDIRRVCKEHNSVLPQISQVKEKLGGLRFYIDHPEGYDSSSKAGQEVRRLITEAEANSYQCCEVTGLPGSLYERNRWVKTLNDEKAKELGYTKVPHTNL